MVVAIFVEQQLYKAATSYAEYSDLTTLERRMAGAVTAYMVHQRGLKCARVRDMANMGYFS